jgi:transglutaminase-like putative cysteine protease
MLLQAFHMTTYWYSEPVSFCHTEVHLKPRNNQNQRLIEHALIIEPQPASVATHYDFFGNEVSVLSIEEPHTTLRITSKSLLECTYAERIHPALTPPWEHVREAVREYRTDESFAAFQFTCDSSHVPIKEVFADYARPSFGAGRPFLQCAQELNERIFTDFKYDQTATTVTTAVEQAFRARHGVCQDFAHVMITCLRSLGLPARYVSGYLRTSDSPVGASASHAWVAVYCPGLGWIDLDPTNNTIPTTDHVTIGWGRDYSDLSPVKGVALDGGEHRVGVEVYVTAPVEKTPHNTFE